MLIAASGIAQTLQGAAHRLESWASGQDAGVGVPVFHAIDTHCVRRASVIGELWNLSVVGPFITGSVQMTKLTWSQRLQELLMTLRAQNHC